MTHRTSWMALAGVALGVVGALAGCTRDNAPDVPYADSGERYDTKADFARLEHDRPLHASDLARVTAGQLKAATQEQVDQIYARLTAGAIPDGPYDGQAFFPKGSSGLARGAEIAGAS